MKELLSRVSNLTINIGAEDEKMNLRKSIEKVSDFEKGLNETTSSQKNEIQALKADVIEAFAWLEDARSRNRQRKSPTFIELKKLEDLDPMSSVLMGEIGHLKYYIENQLKQLYSYLMKELMVHQDSCRYYVKSMMTIPSMEELYKTLYLELKILSEERSIVEDLRRQIAEKSKKGRMQTSLLKSGGEYSKTTTNDRVSELFKLAENLLQIRIDHDEDVNDICVTDAFQLMVKNQINAIAERLKKFTEEKESILRDVFSEREIMKTRSIKSTFGSSSFVRNTSSRIISKYSVAAKMSDREKLQKGKPSGTAETDSSLSQEKTSSSTCENCRPSNRGKFVTSEPTCEAFPVTSREPVKSIFSIATPQQSAVDKEKEKPAQTFTFSLTKPASTVAGGEGETAKSGSGIAKTAPFVFKAPTISTMPAAVTPAAKSTAATPETQRVTPASVAASASSTNSTVFSFKLPDTNSSAASSGATFTFTTVKDSTVSAAADSSVPASGTVPQNMPTISFSAPAFDVRTSSTAASTSSVTFTSSFSSVSVGTATCSNSTIGATSSTIFQPFTFSSTFVPNKSSIETSIFPISKQSSDAASVTAAVSTAEKVSTAGSKSNFIFGSKVPTTAAAEVKTVVSSPPEQLTSRSEAKTITVSPVVGEVNKSVETILTPPVVKNETVQQQQEVKTERVSGKAEEKEESDKKVTSTKETVVTTAAEVVSVVGQETLASKAPTFPQSSATTVFSVSTSNSAVATAFSTSATSPTVSFGMPVSNSGSSIFDRSVPASSTTSANVFSGDRSSIFSQTKATTNSNFFSSVGASTTAFGQPAATTVTSSNIFGQVTMTTSSGSFFGQAGKDDVGQTAKLFGDVLGGGMQQGSVFTPSTSASGNIFGKSAFEKSGVSIFGNTPATTASETASTSIFGNASSNIFSKPSFGQSPTSNSSNIFGQAQPAESNNTFFRQNICNTFGNTSTAAPNQSPFGASTGFNSKPIFGQSLFGQSNTGQNPFERSSSSSIFGGATTASNPFQSSTSSFGSLPPGPFSGGPSTTGQSALGTSQAFQKPLGGFGGAPVFGSVPAPTPSFGAPPTFGGAPTFGSPPHFGNMQKVFGSPQGTFGQSQANAPNFETLANQTADGFANLAQQSQGQAFGGNTFSQGSGFGNNTNFGGSSFSGWRS
ncbi:UNVERIFIED_CONTAM: hypothetical protein PYX00_004126 [Menopon gallinae]|uniref:Nuclear pore complex protein n=1 Tax=Menopon gallinae TaxID=328185 RepID=A0AAW2I2J4_9NEOP